MTYGKVIGTVVATRKDPSLIGKKLLVVQQVNGDGENEGEPVIAIDHVRAGVGDLVFMAKGKDAAWPLDKDTAVDLGIMGIIDIVDQAETGSKG